MNGRSPPDCSWANSISPAFIRFRRKAPTTASAGDAFLEKLETLLREKVDPDEIDRTGEIPQPVIDELAKLGAFGIKIPVEYGGLGLSQTNYCRAAMLLGSWCGNSTALISAHQSIGVPQPLILFGTEEQKRKYLPRVARGEISAFALTETDVGSDPATMATHAEPTPDGKFFILNGEKLWCTNGTKAGVIVVMAQDAAENGQRQTEGPNHGVHRGNGLAGRGSDRTAAGSWACGRFTTASSGSPMSACRAKISCWPKAKACAWR